MTATITAQDGTGDFTAPHSIREWVAFAESGNVVTELLEPGEISAALVGDLPRTGDMKLVYSSDASAEAARLLLARPTSFRLFDPERAALTMTFVRVGRIETAMHKELDGVWEFSVGFQETP